MPWKKGTNLCPNISGWKVKSRAAKTVLFIAFLSYSRSASGSVRSSGFFTPSEILNSDFTSWNIRETLPSSTVELVSFSQSSSSPLDQNTSIYLPGSFAGYQTLFWLDTVVLLPWTCYVQHCLCHSIENVKAWLYRSVCRTTSELLRLECLFMLTAFKFPRISLYCYSTVCNVLTRFSRLHLSTSGTGDRSC